MKTAALPLRIGLTGGIGCGKSTVAALFQRHGVPVIDADRIARELVEPGQPALEEVLDCFGQELRRPDGQLDRARLRRKVFGDPAARARLEGILHPRIYAEIARRCQLLQGPYLVCCIPLLIETGGERFVDRILVVDCPPHLQRQRLRPRGLTDDEIDAILASQAPREKRIAAAQEILENIGTLNDLDRQVEQLHRFYLSLGQQPHDPG